MDVGQQVAAQIQAKKTLLFMISAKMALQAMYYLLLRFC